MLIENILACIPQRPPFVMIDTLLYADEQIVQTGFIVTAGNALVMNGILSEAGLLENIAQTAAARSGYMALLENKPVKSGYISSVKNFEIFHLPGINAELVTEVRIETQVAGIIAISGVVTHNRIRIAQCEMNILVEI